MFPHIMQVYEYQNGPKEISGPRRCQKMLRKLMLSFHMDTW